MKQIHTAAFSLLIGLLFAGAANVHAAVTKPTRCEIVPLPGKQVSLRIDGVEKTRWHFATNSPRPFFYPFNGPGGESLTRIGHPGAPNHDHHLSVWFAHNSVADTIFWSDNSPARIRQKQWLAYRDGDEEGVMACLAGWYDGRQAELLEQETVAALIPLPNGEHALELQLTFRPGKDRESTRLGKTNFGFLAVRVAKSVSAHFGGGRIENSEGGVGEPAVFGKAARWMDYSGPVAHGKTRRRTHVTEGVTVFDHPGNPHHPTAWHVREDGWMGAAFCLRNGYEITAEKPLRLRYLLHAHRGGHDAERAAALADAFSKRPGFRIGKSPRRHRAFEVERLPAE